MAQGTLYDIDNYNDFYDSLAIMETMANKSFKLIFMELPGLTDSTEFIYDLSDYKHSNNINSDFLCRCIERTFHLLTDDGILVFFVPNTNYSNQDYSLVLNQFFSSVTDLVHTCECGQITSVNTLFFCSKQENFNFPTSTKLRPQHLYPYKDKGGLYRLSSLFSSKYTPPYRDYTWRMIRPPKKKQWCYSKEQMEQLYTNGKIVIKKFKLYEKIYRSSEPVPESIWLKKIEDLCDLGDLYHCDYQSLARIFSMYCKPNDSIFCPFDYEGYLPHIAHKKGLRWTSIKIHIYTPSKVYYSLITSTAQVINQLPTCTSSNEYRTDIVTNVNDINELKEQVHKLTSSIQSFKNVLNLKEKDTDLSELGISEDALLERLHMFIFSNINSKMLDTAGSEAEKKYAPFWDKLESSSQKFILTGMVIKKQIDLSTDLDYSAVLIELCKTLENELYTKLFLPYAQLLKSEKVDMNKRYPNMKSQQLTKDFWIYLDNYRNGTTTPITLGCMRDILEKSLARRQRSPLFLDFRSYMHTQLCDSFFETNFTDKLSFISNKRNHCVHDGIISVDDLSICTQLIESKLEHFVKSIY